jgi:deoxyinosine 3'endonuclease (endonuclease V)
MNYPNLHPWKVSIQKAIQIQESLRKRIILSDNLLRIKRIAGVDVAFFDDQAICAACVFEYPKLNLIETSQAKEKIFFPYVPGLLTFREGPVILAAFRRLKSNPDLVLFDGQGICHPRRMGIATHMGIILDIPSIGCAKSHLYGFIRCRRKIREIFLIFTPRPKLLVWGCMIKTQEKQWGLSCGHAARLSQYLCLAAIRFLLERQSDWFLSFVLSIEFLNL